MFQHTNYNSKFLSQPSGAQGVTQYGVQIIPANAAVGTPCWKIIGVHHLSPDENRSRHNAFVEVLDENGQRIKDPNLRICWTWAGRSSDQAAPPKLLDKPDNEPAGDVPIEKGMELELWLEGDGCASDRANKLNTHHNDEPGPNGELWNTIGHHSFYVVFQRVRNAGAGTATSGGSLQDLLVQEGKRAQVLQFNRDAALQKRIFADGFVPNSTEFTINQGSVQYIGQQAEHLASGERRVYYVPVGDWGNVQYVQSA
jgi:hypothetical protein